MKLTVVTSNINKVCEVESFFRGIFDIEHVVLDIPEFRHNDVGHIAREKARYAYLQLGKPVMVDDTGFYIRALGGFPGPYAAYVLDTIGMEGILRLLENCPDRSAYFETAIAYARSTEYIHLFRGRINGTIVEPRGEEGFGYDPIFEVDGKTLAEISLTEKAQMSHRARALAVFRSWLEQGYDHSQSEEPNSYLDLLPSI